MNTPVKSEVSQITNETTVVKQQKCYARVIAEVVCPFTIKIQLQVGT